MINRVLSLLTLVVLVSCTSYQPNSWTGGFSETQLGEKVYQVRFRGNGATSVDRANQFLLRRAAELTLENGYRYFMLSDQQNNDKVDAYGTAPARSATVRFLDASSDSSIDAVFVIRDTNELAEGQLSPAARKALRDLTAAP